MIGIDKTDTLLENIYLTVSARAEFVDFAQYGDRNPYTVVVEWNADFGNRAFLMHLDSRDRKSQIQYSSERLGRVVRQISGESPGEPGDISCAKPTIASDGHVKNRYRRRGFCVSKQDARSKQANARPQKTIFQGSTNQYYRTPTSLEFGNRKYSLESEMSDRVSSADHSYERGFSHENQHGHMNGKDNSARNSTADRLVSVFETDQHMEIDVYEFSVHVEQVKEKIIELPDENCFLRSTVFDSFSRRRVQVNEKVSRGAQYGVRGQSSEDWRQQDPRSDSSQEASIYSSPFQENYSSEIHREGLFSDFDHREGISAQQMEYSTARRKRSYQSHSESFCEMDHRKNIEASSESHYSTGATRANREGRDNREYSRQLEEERSSGSPGLGSSAVVSSFSPLRESTGLSLYDGSVSESTRSRPRFWQPSGIRGRARRVAR